MVGEIIILYNMLFNLILLAFTKTITGLYISKGRLVGSAFASATIATVFAPSFVMTVISFIVLIGLAFSFRLHSFIVQGGWLFVGTLLAGGLLTALQPMLLGRSMVTYIVLCIGVVCVGLLIFKRSWHHKLQSTVQQSYVATCELTLFDQSLTLRAFIDTGNECVEPLSRAPVHFISFKAVKTQLSDVFGQALQQWDEQEPLNLSMFPVSIRKAIRLVPITTIQQQAVVVPAFRVIDLHVQQKSYSGHYVIFTKNDTRFPQNAEMILHVFVLTN